MLMITNNNFLILSIIIIIIIIIKLWNIRNLLNVESERLKLFHLLWHEVKVCGVVLYSRGFF
jgi:hypothetical protein